MCKYCIKVVYGVTQELARPDKCAVAMLHRATLQIVVLQSIRGLEIGYVYAVGSQPFSMGYPLVNNRFANTLALVCGLDRKVAHISLTVTVDGRAAVPHKFIRILAPYTDLDRRSAAVVKTLELFREILYGHVAANINGLQQRC